MKASKIASIAYYVLLAISLVVFVLFFCVGFGREEAVASGFKKAPQFLSLLMYWMYALVAICTVCTVAGAVTSKGGKVDSNMPKWGEVLAQVGTWLFVPVLLITWFMGDDTPIRMGTGELYESKFWLVATDAMIYTIYVLVVVTVLALAVSLSGILKK
jgi:choline-glycine betaine transporter